MHKDVGRPDRGHRRHVPGHVDHLLPLPQSPAGEVDAGPILEHGQLFSRVWPEERRPRRRGVRAIGSRPATCCTRAAASPCRRRRSTASRCRSTAKTGAGVLRRLADGAGQPVLRQAPWSIASGATSWAAAWSRPRTICGKPTRRPTKQLLDALAKDFVDTRYRRQAPDPHDHELGGLPAFIRCRARQQSRRPLLFALFDPAASRRGDARRLLRGDQACRRRSPKFKSAPPAARPGRVDYTPWARVRLQLPDSAGGVAVPRTRSVGPSAARPARASVNKTSSVGQALHLEQRPNAQRQAARQEIARRGVAQGKGRRRGSRAAAVS